MKMAACVFEEVPLGADSPPLSGVEMILCTREIQGNCRLEKFAASFFAAASTTEIYAKWFPE